jgi:hypothetical protein
MLDTDIKTYLSAEVSSAGTNGGRRGTTLVTSGVVNNVWPHVTKAERTSGSELFRKLFTVAADDDDGTLIAANELLDNPTEGDDYIIALAGTQTDTEADISASADKFGSGLLNTDVAIDGQTILVDVEHLDLATGDDDIFRVGVPIRITNKLTPDAVSGTEQTLTPNDVSNVGTLVTIVVDETLDAIYTVAEGTKISSIMVIGDVKTSAENYVVTTAGDGDYNDTSYPLVLDNIGTVEDELTFTWTDATNFTCVGSSGINYGSGTTGGDFSPTNPNNSKPYFVLEYAGFSGTWAGSDTLTIDVHEASFAYWLKRVVPAACSSLANNKVTSVTTGESDA